MAISQPRKRLFLAANILSAAVQVSDVFTFLPNATQWTILLDFNIDCSIAVRWIDTAGQPHTIRTIAYTAGTAFIQTYVENPGEIRLDITPSAATGFTGRAEVTYAGYVAGNA